MFDKIRSYVRKYLKYVFENMGKEKEGKISLIRNQECQNFENL